MPPLPRGTCIVCARYIAMRNNGVTREHRKRIGPKRVGGKCSGSGMRSRERIDAKADASVAEREAAAALPVVLLRLKGEPS